MESILTEVEGIAERLGACDPKWLAERRIPEFTTVEQGSAGPEIVLLHGLFGALSNWEGTMPCMAEYSKPIALHFPLLTGHRSEVKVKALSAFTAHFVMSRELSPVVLCGNSMGGHVAMRLCLAAPHLVDCMILSGTSGLYEHSVDALPMNMDEKFIREHMARVFYNHEFITDEAVEEIVQILKKKMNVLNLIHAARSAKKDNVLNELKNIECPVLLVWGEDDEVTTMDVAEMFHEHIPNSYLVTRKNCGHAPMIEYPDWFAKEVEKFLKEHSKHYNNQ